MCIHTGMVNLWYSTAMVVYSNGCIGEGCIQCWLYTVLVVYSYGQVSTATVSSQEHLAVTVTLGTRRSVMPLCYSSGGFRGGKGGANAPPFGGK